MKQIFVDINGVSYESEMHIEQVPLSGIALIATLNAVLGIWSLTDAANIAQLPEEDLINEAVAWAVAGSEAHPS